MPNETVPSRGIEDLGDRRSHHRIFYQTTLDIEFDSPISQLTKEKAQATQVSHGGLSLLTKQNLPIDSEVILRIPLPNVKIPIHSTARVAWVRQENGMNLHGIKFTYFPSIHKPYFEKFLGSHLATRQNIYERRSNNEIISELVEFKSRNGKKIIGFHDYVLSTSLAAPFIIIPAAYGRTKINSLPIAYYLAYNGFNVIRFDPTNHIGESEGDHLDYSLTSLKDDIFGSIDYVSNRSVYSKVALLGTSLAARVAFKVAAEDPRVDLLISLLGVVDTQKTLISVHNEDILGTYLEGKKWEITNVAGFDVNGETFCAQSIYGNFLDLKTTVNDVQNIHCPVVLFAGENDPWVDRTDVENLISKGKLKEVEWIPVLHKLEENPLEAKKTFKSIVSYVCKHMANLPINPNNIRIPNNREIGVQVKLERERGKFLTSFSKTDESQFWKDYLSRFNYIYASGDYRELLDSVLKAGNTFSSYETILDAGCGNGNFGLWLINYLKTKYENSDFRDKVVLDYYGIDLVENALKNTKDLIDQAQKALKNQHNLNRNFLNPHFQRVDLNQRLPFLDGTFDRVFSNLVISYLQNPLASLKELIRVLKPGGTLVITTLKKDADLCLVYRRFIEKASEPIQIEEARNVLSNASNVLYKESQGLFRFYDEYELENLFKQVSPKFKPEISFTFANQAILAALKK